MADTHHHYYMQTTGFDYVHDVCEAGTLASLDNNENWIEFVLEKRERERGNKWL